MTFDCRALQVTRKVDILTPLGALYYNTGRYEEALQVYREAVTLQPDSTDIWLALVSTHTHCIMECCGISVFSKNTFLLFHTLTISPRQAQVLAMAGRTKEAERMTLDIISREGSCIECYRLLSAIYSKRGNYTEVCVHVCVSLALVCCSERR